MLPATQDEIDHVTGYMQSQAPDLDVTFVQKVYSENVLHVRHDVWDVHTNVDRWWVITEPMNLYSQEQFPNMDLAVTFHIGLCLRIPRSERQQLSELPVEPFAEAYRYIAEAHDSLQHSSEVADYQAIGVRCREVLTVQQADADKETNAEAKKRAHRRYADAVLALSKAFALAGASDTATAIREEVGFFQAIRAALLKSMPGDGKKSAAERELAIQQIVSRAIVSTEIIDIMKAAGLESPDISVLSDDFLAEIRQTDKKNLAIEALRKLINGEVRSRSKANVTQSKAFTERLEDAINRYHNNAITTAQVLEELIQIAKDIRAARPRRGIRIDRRGDRVLRRARRERKCAAGNGRAHPARHRP